jgi:hypothetical protein
LGSIVRSAYGLQPGSRLKGSMTCKSKAPLLSFLNYDLDTALGQISQNETFSASSKVLPVQTDED